MFIHQLLLQTNVMQKIQACHYMNFIEYVINLLAPELFFKF